MFDIQVIPQFMIVGYKKIDPVKNAKKSLTKDYHEFTKYKNGKPVGTYPLDDSHLLEINKSVNRALKTKNKTSELDLSIPLPKNLIQYDPNGTMTWKLDAHYRKLLFKESCDLPSGEYFIPPLIFQTNQTNLKVFSYYEPEFNDKSQLYHAPFPNINSDGLLCIGTAKSNKKPTSLSALMETWEDVLFLSYFTHNIKGDGRFKINPLENPLKQMAPDSINLYMTTKPIDLKFGDLWKKK